MMKALCSLFLLLVFVVAIGAQQPGQSVAWDVTVKANTVADSNLEVVNRCKKNHQFQIQLTNLPFLHFSSTQVNVKGGASQLVPVKFDTRSLAPGVYQGTVLVICQSCKGEDSCTQDREVLQVVLRVTSDSPAAGPPVVAPQNLSLDLEALRQAEAEARAAAAGANQAAGTAEEEARQAQAQADAAEKAKDDAVKAENKALGEVADAERERAEAKNPTSEERAALQAAVDKAKADLAEKEKARKDAQAVLAGNPQAAANAAAKEAAEKKAEADRAATALAAAQAAAAEKEKEILKAQQEAATTAQSLSTGCTPPAQKFVKSDTSLPIHIVDEKSEFKFEITIIRDTKGRQEAQDLAAWFRGVSNLGGLIAGKLPKGAPDIGMGVNIASLIFAELDAGADILDAASRARLTNVDPTIFKINFEVETTEITPYCDTWEVCRNGVWVIEKRYGQSVAKSKVTITKTIEMTGKDWGLVSSGPNGRFDPEKADDCASGLLKGVFAGLNGNKATLATAQTGCK